MNRKELPALEEEEVEPRPVDPPSVLLVGLAWLTDVSTDRIRLPTSFDPFPLKIEFDRFEISIGSTDLSLSSISDVSSPPSCPTPPAEVKSALKSAGRILLAVRQRRPAEAEELVVVVVRSL